MGESLVSSLPEEKLDNEITIEEMIHNHTNKISKENLMKVNKCQYKDKSDSEESDIMYEEYSASDTLTKKISLI